MPTTAAAASTQELTVTKETAVDPVFSVQTDAPPVIDDASKAVAEEAEPTFAVQTEPWTSSSSTTTTTTTKVSTVSPECVEGATGPGVGTNWCNTCTCVNGAMSMCTRMGCGDRSAIETRSSESLQVQASASTAAGVAPNTNNVGCLGRYRGPLVGMRGSVQGIANVAGESVAHCGQLCDTTTSRGNKPCVSFSYRADKGRCWMFMMNEIIIGTCLSLYLYFFLVFPRGSSTNNGRGLLSECF